MIARCIREAGIGFMFAPAHHSAMKHVGPARAELGFRTVFNLLGPLSNPAGVKRYLLGVFSPDWVEPLAHVLVSLGAERAWVVHGDGGLDEISPAGRDQGRGARERQGPHLHVTPEDAGPDATPRRRDQGRRRRAQRRGASRALLAGAPGAYRDTVLLNAAAALVVAGKAQTLGEGARSPPRSSTTARARERLDRLVAVSNG